MGVLGGEGRGRDHAAGGDQVLHREVREAPQCHADCGEPRGDGDEQVFWDVKDPAKAVVIELADERYSRLVVEVSDPRAAVGLIEAAKRAG
ncbi:hypothetical protein ACWGB8_35325 [Kitasatospora sp. NPDC054939]